MPQTINNMRRKILSAQLNSEETTHFNIDNHSIIVGIFESKIHKKIARAIEIYEENDTKFSPLLIKSLIEERTGQKLTQEEEEEFNIIIQDKEITDNTYSEYEKNLILKVGAL